MEKNLFRNQYESLGIRTVIIISEQYPTLFLGDSLFLFLLSLDSQPSKRKCEKRELPAVFFIDFQLLSYLVPWPRPQLLYSINATGRMCSDGGPRT